METFTWRPLIETPSDTEFNVASMQFGDGYKQAIPFGINTKKDSYNLTFKGHKTKIDAIKAFLDARNGAEAFLWTPKGESQAIFECKAYQRINHSGNDSNDGIWSLMAKFEQRFGE